MPGKAGSVGHLLRYDDRTISALFRRYGQVNGRGRFPGAAFLICNDDGFHERENTAFLFFMKALNQDMLKTRCKSILRLHERHGQQDRFGNKMGTGLAISAQCGYNVRALGQYRNCLAIKAFKYHRNVFPIPRVWQTYRTQNLVQANRVGSSPAFSVSDSR